jgi:hypothetical protein
MKDFDPEAFTSYLAKVSRGGFSGTRCGGRVAQIGAEVKLTGRRGV